MYFNKSVQCLKSVGEKRQEALNKLGVYSVGDLIEFFPRGYEDRSNIKTIASVSLNEKNSIRAKIRHKPENLKYKGLTVTKAKLWDKNESIEAVWFNQPYLKNSLKLNTEAVFTGKVTKKKGLQIENPEVDYNIDKSLSNGRIVPVYSLTKGVNQKLLRGLIFNALEEYKAEIFEFIPSAVIDEFDLATREFAIKNIHFPASDEAFFKARERLVFEELFLFQLKLLQLKNNIKKQEKKVFLENLSVERLLECLPFSLTKAQTKVWEELCEDFKSDEIMNRLVQGDVGSGKTAIAYLACYVHSQGGYQSALMAPTDVLANQHYKSFRAVFDKLGVETCLLTGSMSPKERKETYKRIKEGNVDIIIGTHALIQKSVEFCGLGLVITDEQHRFGVNQRVMLSQKGLNPNVLVLTATPIPRTLGLILYGDLDISIIDKLPPNRQSIDTSAVNSSYNERVFGFVRKHINEGRQAYVICPMIEQGESDLKAAVEYTQSLRENELSGLRVECLHGKMKPNVKQEIMDSFARGDIDVLVSTTVIEVGIDVPNATVMVIANAERFGLSALHQLRGRVGRGKEKSYCVLISDSESKLAWERLKTLCKVSDGFKISEKDLELRGPGDFFGTRQHGLPEMKIANLYEDIEILKKVQKAVKAILDEKISMTVGEKHRLNQQIELFFRIYGENSGI